MEVPVDYSDPTIGTTAIYYYFPSSFEPSKPTLAFFTGGPGQSVHILDIPASQFLRDLPFNLLLMEQRGIACSAPAKEATQLSPSFYSSENVARDLNEIRKVLGVQKLSVYGASYGTVPATIYGSLFAESTRSVVLEGTVFTGFELMFKADSSVTHLGQKLIDSLSPESRRKFIDYLFSVSPDGEGFGQFVRFLLSSGGKLALRKAASVIEEAMVTSDPDKINEWAFSNAGGPKDMFYTDLVNRILFCKEFGATIRDISMLQRLDRNGRVQDIPQSNDYASIACPRYGFKEERPSTYKADSFPVSVPVTYFQGGGDSATIPQGFAKHFKAVPKDKRFAWILVDGGHMPTQQLNREGSTEQRQALRDVFIAALEGSAPSQRLISILTDKRIPLRWAFTDKAVP